MAGRHGEKPYRHPATRDARAASTALTEGGRAFAQWASNLAQAAQAPLTSPERSNSRPSRRFALITGKGYSTARQLDAARWRKETPSDRRPPARNVSPILSSKFARRVSGSGSGRYSGRASS